MTEEVPVAGDEPETILCDTSFVSVVQSAEQHGGMAATWADADRARLDAAVLAISVIALAELRDGHIYGGWGESRRRRAEQRIATYLLVPLDMTIVDRCAELRAACRSSGVTVPDNDIWIAATASTRGWSLASCDGHFDLIRGIDHFRLPLPPWAPGGPAD
jgi:predicted nucleic acid-binding protein